MSEWYPSKLGKEFVKKMTENRITDLESTLIEKFKKLLKQRDQSLPAEGFDRRREHSQNSALSAAIGPPSTLDQ